VSGTGSGPIPPTGRLCAGACPEPASARWRAELNTHLVSFLVALANLEYKMEVQEIVPGNLQTESYTRAMVSGQASSRTTRPSRTSCGYAGTARRC
jgi:hypothetical protein